MKKTDKATEFQMMHIRIPKVLYEKLASYAENQGRSITSQVIRFLNSGIEDGEY